MNLLHLGIRKYCFVLDIVLLHLKPFTGRQSAHSLLSNVPTCDKCISVHRDNAEK
jgi:hypothetical protein